MRQRSDCSWALARCSSAVADVRAALGVFHERVGFHGAGHLLVTAWWQGECLRVFSVAACLSLAGVVLLLALR